MLKKILSALLIILTMNLGIIAFAGTKETKEARFVEKLKAGISKLGTGEKAKIEVKMKDGTKLKGFISEANDEQFVVTDAKTGKSTVVAYSQVRKAKGNNLSQNTVFIIALAAIIIIPIILLATASN